jgi:uncharacterized protein YerC
MTKVSRRELDKNLEEYIFTIFLKTIADLKTLTEVEKFLEDLLWPTEKIMLIKRLAIAVMLYKGYTYDEIDHTLKVSRNTIMNVSYFLKHGQSGGYQKVVARVLADQKKETMFDKIEELLLQFSPPKMYGSGAYERKRRLGKELFRRKSLRNNF